MPVDIQKINAIAELEHLGLKFDAGGNGEVKVCCPLHDDNSPSASINTETNLWKCHAAGCDGHGDIVTFLAFVLKVERKTVLIQLAERYDLDVQKSIAPEVVEKYHGAIWSAKTLLKALYERGLTDEDIRLHRLGFSEGRITIPVYDLQGRVINVRKYLPGAPGHLKMRNVPGMQALAIYKPDQLKYSTVWLCGGEMKAIAAARMLNPLDIGAFSLTAAEGSWDSKFSPLMKDKTVYVCMDIDQPGRQAARKVAARLEMVCSKVFIVQLPLDQKLFPKGDINNWIVSAKPTAEDWKAVMQGANVYQYRTIDDEDLSDVVDVQLSEATSAANLGKKLSLEGLVVTMDTTPYLVPKDVSVKCDRDQTNCDICPIKGMKENPDTGLVKQTLPSAGRGLLSLINTNQQTIKAGIKLSLKIPPCKSVDFTIMSHQRVFDVRLSPTLNITGTNSEHVIQPAYIVNESQVEMHVPYALQGRVWPHPKTQQAILLLNDMTTADDSLSSFKQSAKELETLKIFQPDEWTVDSIQKKLDDIYIGMASHVTRIFNRHELHLAIDLAYHSVLHLPFDDRTINGWINLLVLGDSSQGKTEVASRFIEHYGLGARHDCKNASVAGLLGGCKEVGKRWFITWGAIPSNDRQLVFLEEVKGMSQEGIGHLTDMRTSGVAEISMIEKRKAHARTRLVFISNPRTNRPLNAYSFGVEAVAELIGAMEDVRRFDFVLTMSADEIDTATINDLSLQRREGEFKYDSDLCRRLVLFAWTRTPHQIKFDPDAELLCRTEAIRLCGIFDETIPILDRGTTRLKIARLSAALAARTYSVDPVNPELLIVRACHVSFISRFVEEQYSKKSCGYRDFSQARTFTGQLIDERQVERGIRSYKHSADLIRHLLHQDQILVTDLQDWCETDRDTAQKLLSLLVRKHALQRDDRFYVKTSQFITLLKKMSSGVVTVDHEEGERF